MLSYFHPNVMFAEPPTGLHLVLPPSISLCN